MKRVLQGKVVCVGSGISRKVGEKFVSVALETNFRLLVKVISIGAANVLVCKILGIL